VVRSNRWLQSGEDQQLAVTLWAPFGDVFEGFRRALESALDVPCRYSGAMPPPAFIMHMPSLIQTHPQAFDVHEDSALPLPVQHTIVTELRASNAGWRRAECEFEAQLSILVALSMPAKLDAGLEWYSRFEGRWRKHTSWHRPGRMVILEARRPHMVRPFTLAASDSSEIRMTIHAFAIRCRASDDKDAPQQYLITGVM